MSVNKAILVGRLGSDPEVRSTQSGTSVANMSLATNRYWKDQSGQRQEETEWHRVVFFNRLAEIVEQYVKKGSKLYIEGRLQTRSWEQDGIKRYSTEIIASEMQMLDSRGQSNDMGGSNYGGGSQQYGNAPQGDDGGFGGGAQESGFQPAPAGSSSLADDDIPF